MTEAADSAWLAVGDSAFVSLGTYRRSGERVDTPVWVAPLGDGLVVTTEIATGKVKRLRHDARARMQPCSRLGRVDPTAPAVDGVAEILGPGPEADMAVRALARKYGFQFRAFLAVERAVRRITRRDARRVIIRMTEQPG